MERILEEQDVYGRTMSWEALGYEAGLDVSGRTIERAMGTKDYHRCVACNKTWISQNLAKKRVDWATLMKARYPTKYTWRKVRFSDESHAGHGPQGKLIIIRRKGERYCPKCVQRERDVKEDAKKKVHVWGAAGYDFKSDLTTYDVPSNTTGKMSQSVYIDSILDPIIKPWIQNGHDFIIEEDQVSGHGPTRSKGNIVKE
ncbi:hypothetical protein P152DRAFT_301152 [Eremomyces bilateralis CBS 781.70]|uniref:Uncharacterized protein n=1 Tax=Eremomyces bilateralis CBS 781.70 TaxID=1392243 RepID=A0A6G1G7V5_9PEZI|nr:uncharacterized protein P152DRAFT_301152 [Eremomyces bilateralis CBS 781.70]KAF1814001.1 hypothetical protein P152DRAFT_301152 [Eremomyces bilateralis CBS 781.70]